jgi:hypothetical protein
VIKIVHPQALVLFTVVPHCIHKKAEKHAGQGYRYFFPYRPKIQLDSIRDPEILSTEHFAPGPTEGGNSPNSGFISGWSNYIAEDGAWYKDGAKNIENDP